MVSRMRTDQNLSQTGLSCLLFGILTIIFETAEAQVIEHRSPVYVPVQREIRDTTPVDVNSESSFQVVDMVANRFLAIQVEFTKSTINPNSATLARGPGRSNSSAFDLTVTASGANARSTQYRISDPRLQKLQDGPWEERSSAEKVIYIPLSDQIDSVEIAPASPARGGVVSAGGSFDPRPWATLACTGADPDEYPECSAILALGISPPP